MSLSRADAIAATVLDQFDRLPANRKPAVRTNGVREWVPLSGIVAEFSDGQLACLAMATGMKCLPASRLPAANGVGLHDWHAEVLAMRAFNHFVLQECRDVLLAAKASPFVRQRPHDQHAAGGPDASTTSHAAAGSKDAGPASDVEVWTGQPFAWRDDVALHMYCSEAPCGDASMELTMAAQDDASPWALPLSPNGAAPAASAAAAAAPAAVDAAALAGRAYFSQLGAVRRKPGRGDAPPSLSKSCSDKLALRQCTTLLGALAALLVAPSRGLCLRSLVLPASQYTAAGCRRSFGLGEGGRMRAVAGRRWPGGYDGAVPLAVQTTTREFAFSRRAIAATVVPASSASPASPTSPAPASPAPAMASSNLAVAWTRHGAVDECLVGGVLRGRRAFDPAGASAVSRRRLWQLARETAEAAAAAAAAQVQAPAEKPAAPQLQALCDLLRQAPTYGALKASPLLAARARVKADVQRLALPGWVRNTGDEDWGLAAAVAADAARTNTKRKRNETGPRKSEETEDAQRAK